MNNDVFQVPPEELHDRLDANFHNPKFFETIETIKTIAENKEGFVVSALRALLEESDDDLALTGGATPYGANYTEEGIPFLRVQNIRRNHLVLHNVKYIPRIVHEGELARSQLKPGDVLLTITGMTYGLSAVVSDTLQEANMNQHSARIRVDQETILPEYLS